MSPCSAGEFLSLLVPLIDQPEHQLSQRWRGFGICQNYVRIEANRFSVYRAARLLQCLKRLGVDDAIRLESRESQYSDAVAQAAYE